MNSFRNILAEVDPRSAEQPAIERLRQIAGDDDVAIHLLLSDSMDASVDYAGDGLEDAQAEYVSRLERWLDEQAGRLGRPDVTTELVWHAPRYEAILDRASAAGADLIMRSARYHSKFERLFVSATDWELIRRAPQTVWLVKHGPADRDEGLKVFAAVDPVHAEERKLGLDRRVLETATGIAEKTGGEAHLFHAWQPGLAMAPAIAASPHIPLPVVRVDARTIEKLRAERESQLDELGQAAGVADEHRHLVEGAVTDALDELVGKYDFDVVVAGGISRGAIERLVIGNTAEAILERADCDVVVVKPAKASREDRD